MLLWAWEFLYGFFTNNSESSDCYVDSYGLLAISYLRAAPRACWSSIRLTFDDWVSLFNLLPEGSLSSSFTLFFLNLFMDRSDYDSTVYVFSSFTLMNLLSMIWFNAGSSLNCLMSSTLSSLNILSTSSRKDSRTSDYYSSLRATSWTPFAFTYIVASGAAMSLIFVLRRYDDIDRSLSWLPSISEFRSDKPLYFCLSYCSVSSRALFLCPIDLVWSIYASSPSFLI